MQNDDMTFAQLTVVIKAIHKFVAYDERGNIVAGSPIDEVGPLYLLLSDLAASIWL